MQDKGRSPAAELESNVANPGAGGSAAHRGRNECRSLEDKPVVPRFSLTKTSHGGGSGAAGVVYLCKRRRWATMTHDHHRCRPDDVGWHQRGNPQGTAGTVEMRAI